LKETIDQIQEPSSYLISQSIKKDKISIFDSRQQKKFTFNRFIFPK